MADEVRLTDGEYEGLMVPPSVQVSRGCKRKYEDASSVLEDWATALRDWRDSELARVAMNRRYHYVTRLLLKDCGSVTSCVTSCVCWELEKMLTAEFDLDYIRHFFGNFK